MAKIGNMEFLFGKMSKRKSHKKVARKVRKSVKSTRKSRRSTRKSSSKRVLRPSLRKYSLKMKILAKQYKAGKFGSMKWKSVVKKHMASPKRKSMKQKRKSMKPRRKSMSPKRRSMKPRRRSMKRKSSRKFGAPRFRRYGFGGFGSGQPSTLMQVMGPYQ